MAGKAPATFRARRRFATAVFIVLSRDSGELTYVNAGHNAPIVFFFRIDDLSGSNWPTAWIVGDAGFEVRKAVINPSGTLVIFTDGLTDSIQAEPPENRVCAAFAESAGRMMANLKSLVDPKFNEDDVTMLLVKRIAGFAHSGVSAKELSIQRAES